MRRFMLTVAAIAMLATTTVFASAQPGDAQDCNYGDGVVDCYGWTFNYEMSSASVIPTGLTMYNLFHNDESLMYQAHFAALPVKYDDNMCGPFVDLFSTVTNSDPQGIQVGTFVEDDVQWLEMGAHFQIGSYVLYNAFYFSELGEMKMRMFARGLQCNGDHIHWPMFVVDADVEGPTTAGNNGQQYHGVGDELFYLDDGEWIAQTSESDKAVSDFGHDWIVRDPISTKTVAINYDDGVFAPPSRDTVDPDAASFNVVYARQSNGFGDLVWPGASAGDSYLFGNAGLNNAEWAYNNDEVITDPVIVVRGQLDHDYAPNLPDDWHTSGISVRMVDDPFGLQTELGDTTCDGLLTVGDALVIAQYAVGNRVVSSTCPVDLEANEIYLAAADVNSNGTVNVGDALLVAQCAASIPNVACPEDPPPPE